jgi:hypothetical protein
MEFVNTLAYHSKIFDFKRLVHPLAFSNYAIFLAIFYLNYFFVLPRYLGQKKYKQALSLWVLLVLAFVGSRYFIQEYLFLKYYNICNFCGVKAPVYFVNNFFQALSSLILGGTVIWFIDNWLKIEKQKIVLEQEKVLAERALLQSQVNPHFLFNTLNNIYSMVFHHSEHSLKAIKKLSEIMRYCLKESASDWVDLSTEVSYLKNYIALQQYRVKNPAVLYEESGSFANKTIPPMLLISFVENAFKHGILNDPHYPIAITIAAGEKELTFIVSNKISRDSKDAVSGVGLASVKKRLQLYYGPKHVLQIKEDDQNYCSKLILST